MYKTFTSIYLTIGSLVKTAKEIISIFKIKDGGGKHASKDLPNASTPGVAYTSFKLTMPNPS